MSLAIESSYKFRAEDMGDQHIIHHKDQHHYLLPGEKPVEVIRGTMSSSDYMAQAIRQGQRLGMRTPKQQAKWNQHQRKSGHLERVKTYSQYLDGVCSRTIKGLEQQKDNPRNNLAKRKRASEDLNAIKRNKIPIRGTLLYLSNYSDYERHKKLGDFPKYRQFEADTLKTFLTSKTYAILDPGNFAQQLHRDEVGVMHAQGASFDLHVDGRHRAICSTKTVHKNALIKFFGGKTEYRRRMDLLCEEHKKQPNYKGSEKIGKVTIAAMLYDDLAAGKKPQHHASAKECKARIEELWRVTLLHELGQVALQKSRQYGVDYQVSRVYQTDGTHLDRTEYIAQQNQLAAAQKSTQALVVPETKKRKQLQQKSATLTKQVQTQERQRYRNRLELKDAKDAKLSLAGLWLFEVKNKKSTDKDLDKIPLPTPRTMVKQIKKRTDQMSNDAAEARAENQLLRVDNQQCWIKLRTIIVDFVEDMFETLEELWKKRKKRVKEAQIKNNKNAEDAAKQDFRNSVTNLADKRIKPKLLQPEKQYEKQKLTGPGD